MAAPAPSQQSQNCFFSPSLALPSSRRIPETLESNSQKTRSLWSLFSWNPFGPWKFPWNFSSLELSQNFLQPKAASTNQTQENPSRASKALDASKASFKKEKKRKKESLKFKGMFIEGKPKGIQTLWLWESGKAEIRP